MTLTLSETPILAVGTSIPYGTTETNVSTSGTGAFAALGAATEVGFAYKITNGANAPGSPLIIVFYGANSNQSGARLYEIDRVSGNTVANDNTATGHIPAPKTYPYYTAKAFANTSQNVTVEVFLEQQLLG